MDMTMIPPWMSNLDDEDMTFIKRFLLASGSMKEVAAQYGVSRTPPFGFGSTGSSRKIQLGEQIENEPYIALINGSRSMTSSTSTPPKSSSANIAAAQARE